MKIIAQFLSVTMLLTVSVGHADSQRDLTTIIADAEQGDVRAIVKLGWIYRYGRGVPHNDTEAARWYLMAAEKGDVGAQNTIGSMYALGQGVPLDEGKALGNSKKLTYL